jgi:WXG100 family type VII secretion target
MANQFTTGSAEMLQAVKSMEDVNQSLQGNLKNLASEVEQVASGWKGSAATAFNTLMTKFNEDATKLNQDLQQIAEAVSGNQKNYQQQEDEAAQSVSAIANALNG